MDTSLSRGHQSRDDRSAVKCPKDLPEGLFLGNHGQCPKDLPEGLFLGNHGQKSSRKLRPGFGFQFWVYKGNSNLPVWLSNNTPMRPR